MEGEKPKFDYRKLLDHHNADKLPVRKGVDYFTKEIEKAGLMGKMPFFNDVIVELRPPNEGAGYGEPILKDVIMDNGQIFDIYHSDHAGGTWHRLFLHNKTEREDR